jgi:predicted anti-sigma-YlaC factor YlaD
MWGMGAGTRCEQAREHLSAMLDGEGGEAGGGGEDGRAEAHLAGCPACSRWWEQARTLARMTRTAAALPAPALSPQALDHVLAAAPTTPARSTRARRVVRVLRMALLTVGLAQFLLGFAQISNFARIADSHTHPEGVPVASGHLWHESAAWNVAIGAALAWLAWRRSRPASLLPVMTAFVAVLALLTANDAMAGRVEGDRILSHGLLLAGYGLLLVLNHPRLRDHQPPAGRVRRPTPWSLGGTADDGQGPSAAVYPFPVRARVPDEIVLEKAA